MKLWVGLRCIVAEMRDDMDMQITYCLAQVLVITQMQENTKA